MIPRKIVLLIAISALASCLRAQDTRLVVEPLFPPLCATVDAQLTANGHSLAPEDEQKVDTARIQRAIDKCGRGRAVKLRVNEDKNAFLSGPLLLKQEVTLILDRGVTLFASREAANFDRRMGSCGIVNDVGAGCRPLITVQKADGGGVMGDGTIDGRGGEKLLNSQHSWWELAQEPESGGYARLPRLISVEDSDHVTLYRVTLKNAPAETVYFDHGEGLTIYGVHIQASQEAGHPKAIVTGDGAKDVQIAASEGTGR
jgi:polygalacturonase